MQQHLTHSRGSNARLDQIPDFVIAAAVKGIRRALREIVHDRRIQSKSTISRLPTEKNHD
jgi:hypothetical protein